jgi:hypothetical protein
MTSPPPPAVKIDDALTVPSYLLPDVFEMLEAHPDREYYQFTLGADPDGPMYCSAYTHWVGWTDDTPRHELREPSIVDGGPALELLYSIGQPALIVEGTRQFAVWNTLGGHGLVERATAEEFMADRLLPSSCAPAPTGSGFVGLSSRSSQELQYAPSPKLRMEILKRDRFRCRGQILGQHLVELPWVPDQRPVLQVGPPRRGAGPRQCSLRIRRTDDAETRTPSDRPSPTVRS